MKTQFIILATVLLGILFCAFFSSPALNQNGETPTSKLECSPLPDSFSDTDLVGTWIAEYFGGLATDKLIIREDGLFKQIYSSEPRNFESDWKKWSIEYHQDGYALLHLEGMRRCDDTETICNNPGGGLPSDEVAINQCDQEYLHYKNEVILIVTGYDKPVPRDVVLRQAKLAGSDWTYSFRLDESANP